MEKQRRGGKSAAETRCRLPARTDSEGKAHCEEGPGSPGRRTEQSACNEGEWSRKRSEPQGRQWDATSPRPDARRNPSRWSETTRADRDFMAWQPWGRRKARVFREWTCRRDVDGGAQRIPGEAALSAPERSGECLEGEAKGGWSARQALRSRSTVTAGSPRGPGRKANGRGGRVAKANERPMAVTERGTGNQPSTQPKGRANPMECR